MFSTDSILRPAAQASSTSVLIEDSWPPLIYTISKGVNDVGRRVNLRVDVFPDEVDLAARRQHVSPPFTIRCTHVEYMCHRVSGTVDIVNTLKEFSTFMAHDICSNQVCMNSTPTVNQ